MYRNIIRNELQQFTPYCSARMQSSVTVMNLNANESPWDTSQGYNRYPEQQPQRCVKALATLFQVDQNQLLITRGSDEGIDLLIRLCCTAFKDAIMINPPTYGMYQVYADVQACSVIAAPGSIDQMLQGWQPNIKVMFLCNPNNPTGELVPTKTIETLCAAVSERALVVIDEAYIEFAEQASMVSYLQRYPNLVILRTLSKAYGLAGIRCGAVLGNPELIRWLKNILAPYPIATPVVDCITSRLSNIGIARAESNVEQIKRERETLTKALVSLPYINKVWPSQTNFILFELERPERLFEYLIRQRIAVRLFKTLSAIRISIGTTEQNQTITTLLQQFGDRI